MAMDHSFSEQLCDRFTQYGYQHAIGSNGSYIKPWLGCCSYVAAMPTFHYLATRTVAVLIINELLWN